MPTGAPPDDGPEVTVAVVADARAAREHVLVLLAVGIPVQVDAGEDCVALRVAPEFARDARAHLDAHARENAAPAAQRLERGRYAVPAMLGTICLLYAVFVADGQHLWGAPWLAAGAAEAETMLWREPWRAATALTLHAGTGHLLSNIAFGTIAVLLLAAVLGGGIAGAATLTTGILGNFASALIHGPGHTAVGASTAVFGALGLLGGCSGARRVAVGDDRPMRRWTPLAAAAMLFALLGVAGERTDVAAHLGGLAAGAGLGAAVGRLPTRALDSAAVQVWSGGLTWAALAAAWGVALI